MLASGEVVRASARPLLWFFAMMAGLAALRFVVGFVQAPIAYVPTLSIAVAIVFMVVPICACFVAAGCEWTLKLCLGFTLGGAAGHFAMWEIASRAFTHLGFGVALALGGMQIALFTWCIGLGALVSRLFKEPNVLLPLCIFLALFDTFLVLTPSGVTKMMMASAPEAFHAIAHTIPRVQSQPTHGHIVPMGFVGPADFAFMSMFFVAMRKFRMRSALTLIVLIPTLLLYMSLAQYFGSVPLLVPIGLCVVVVNWREFTLTRQETMSTALVSALGLGLILWSMSRKPSTPDSGPPIVPSQSAPGQSTAGSPS